MKNRYIKLVLIMLISLICFNKIINVSAIGNESSATENCIIGKCEKGQKEVINLIVVVVLILILLTTIRFIYLSIKQKNKIKKILSKTNPNLDKDKFLEQTYQIFYDIQMGWMEFDYDKLKSLLSNELYNTYQMILEALKAKKQKNIIKDFELIGIKLSDIKEEKDKYIAKVELEVKFVDYTINIETNEVIKGSDNHRVYNYYILTFEKEKIINICPKCGTNIGDNITGICNYCGSKLVNKTYDWVLSKRERIRQR